MVLLFLIAFLKGCGDNMFVVPILEDARKVFDNIPEWNVVLWSNMIAGYALNGKDEEALKHFNQVPDTSLTPSMCILQEFDCL